MLAAANSKAAAVVHATSSVPVYVAALCACAMWGERWGETTYTPTCSTVLEGPLQSQGRGRYGCEPLAASHCSAISVLALYRKNAEQIPIRTRTCASKHKKQNPFFSCEKKFNKNAVNKALLTTKCLSFFTAAEDDMLLNLIKIHHNKLFFVLDIDVIINDSVLRLTLWWGMTKQWTVWQALWRWLSPGFQSQKWKGEDGVFSWHEDKLLKTSNGADVVLCIFFPALWWVCAAASLEAECF